MFENYKSHVFYFKIREQLIKSFHGIFFMNDFPKKVYSQKNYYLVKYYCKNGSWIDIDDPICKIRIGELNSLFGYKYATIFTLNEGYLEYTKSENEIIKENDLFYKIHENGIITDLYDY